MIKVCLILSAILLIALGVSEFSHASAERNMLLSAKLGGPDASETYQWMMKKIRFDKYKAIFLCVVALINAAAAYHLHKMEKKQSNSGIVSADSVGTVGC